jgi:orotidine-5'-phosphate decarboxylase
MKNKLIIALDFFNQADALNFIKEINPEHCALKIGSEMFTRFGTEFVRYLIKQHYKIFLDLKFHDIPNTVAQACKAAAELGVWMVNVHTLGGLKMMQAAREALVPYGSDKPLLIGVTVLTSMANQDLHPLGIISSLEEQIARLTSLAYQAGLDGVVCSAHEALLIKSIGGTSFLAVTPGIRLSSDSADDQVRIMTPQQAIEMGSDYLVIGRSITRAMNPKEIINSVLHCIKQ